MIPSPPAQRFALPVLPPAQGRAGFPVIATLAPVAVSLTLWAVTQSIYSLLFAALGPIVAVGGLIDGRFARRRAARRDRARFRSALDLLAARVREAHGRERDRLSALGALAVIGSDPDAAADEPWRSQLSEGEAVPVHLGRATLVAPVDLTGDDPDDAPAALAAAVVTVRHRVVHLRSAPVVVDARDGIGIVAPDVVAAAFARAVVAQVAALLPPDVVSIRAPRVETWVSSLPHDVRFHDDARYRLVRSDGSEIVVATATDAARLPLGCGVVVRWSGTGAELVRQPGDAPVRALRPLTVSAARARGVAALLTRVAEVHGLRPSSALLPARVDLANLLEGQRGHPPLPGLQCVVGVDAEGPVFLDLVADGPHAVVAGTTGSGKSELLVSWVLGMAALHPPDVVTFLLVDFKGGSAFAPLAGLPHVIATLSDLDARLTRRAIQSLRAEIMSRERTLAAHRARAIDELPVGVLPRLVVVVDEFAAVVSESPELHDVFADLAARGRSLGLHLVLCTQRPSGVVRDAVLANVTLRLSLRVTDRADSVAMIGNDAAARLPGDVTGRAILADAHGQRDIQVAIATAADAEDVRVRTPVGPSRRPWCDPLPTRVRLADLPAHSGGLAFGLADHPAEQLQPAAVHDATAHGHLLVIGTAGSGKSTALSTLQVSASRAGRVVIKVPDMPADAWAVIGSELARGTGAGGEDAGDERLLVVDDLDLLVSRFDSDYRHEVLDLLARLAREGSARRLVIVASVQRLTGPLAAIAALFGARLVLRQPTRDEHVLAGGDGAVFDPDLPPGAGWWRGAAMQVAVADTSPAPTVIPRPTVVRLGEHPILAVVASRPRPVAAMLRAAGARVHEIGGFSAGDLEGLRVTTSAEPVVLLGDPDAWHGDWGALNWARRDLPMLLIGCTAADHRTLLRDRELPPLLGADPGECWFADGERTQRCQFALPAMPTTMESAPKPDPNC